MRFPAVLSIAILLFMFTNVQNLYGQSEIEVLKKKLDSLSGGKKVVLLLKLSKKTLNKSAETAMDFGNKALQLAKILKHRNGEATALVALANCYIRLRKYDKALQHYQQAIAIFNDLDAIKDMASAKVELGNLYRTMRKFKKALDLHFKTKKIFETLKDQKNVAYSIYYIAKDYSEMGRNQDAVDHFLQSLEMLKPMNLKKDVADIFNNLGIIYYRWSKYSEAMQYFRDALETYRSVNDKYNSASCLTNIGIIQDITGKYAQAVETYMKALRVYEEMGNMAGISTSYNNIGVIYRNLGKNEKAIEYYRKAVVIQEQMGNIGNASIMYNNIGIVHKNLNQYDKALENYNKALKMAESVDLKSNVARVLGNIGNIFLKKNQLEQALTHYRKSMSIAESIGEESQVATALLNIGATYKNAEKYDLSLDYLGRALKKAQEMDLKDMISDIYFNLSEIQKERKNYKKALEYYTLYTNQKDAILDKETNSRIAELQTRYETEKKENRIAALEKDNQLLLKDKEIQRLVLSKERVKANAFIAGFVLVLIIALLIFRKYLHLFAFWKKRNYIGHYKILGQIGAGGMGVIYKAAHIMRKSEPVAVKVIREEFSKDENQRKRFLNEAMLVDQLNHPNIIKVYERGEFNRQLYMAMEMLEGPSLADIIDKGEMLPLQDCLSIMTQLTTTVTRIHHKGIIHRDLKPDNIIVIERNGNRNFVKLLDFGLARSQNLSRLTGTGEILGTINYLSPEQISRQEYTPSGDIYSLGVVFYELITMEKPFIGEIPVDIIRQILDKDPIPPLRYRPDLDPGVEELILEMMDKSPAARPSGEYICQTLQRMNREITQ